MYFPDKLMQATKVSFQGPISGYLLDARPAGAGFKGAMFFDSHQRSGNGETVITDDVAMMEDEQGYSVVVTVRGERYVIVSFLLFMVEEVDGGEQTVVLSMSRNAANSSS
ncbi:MULTISPECIES: hypothetical protein [Pseudomonas syringae group genomosp. 2]|uniref:Uncharacterized protein n=3 Tax=Pseudomonas syringae group genomosp. 2 TaxID=251698 RepID=A0AAX1VT44_PSEAJ|nr:MULTISPECIES: hypothetical protein [Pseudomonas syringae group genomosp. 2]KPX63100.1 Uncharacterized protein ALO35_03770 [Pseudomonas amygdali pv. lachrymans]KEZ27693.1 hypothetical protein A3SK_0108700 [Pseudomonas amygdali pv. tabaci str. 6605]KPY83028.1 Uncharacterized protein ALO60_02468 [Pseudomonas amygdali pv. tabaci]QOI04011.1 hypothetical protein D5S10_09055 [Pseudomonas savastanoi]RML80000.1 hypothetical protein ALQ89_00227 [Pseudomonas amygdali pv. tabaci]